MTNTGFHAAREPAPYGGQVAAVAGATHLKRRHGRAEQGPSRPAEDESRRRQSGRPAD